MKHRFARFAVLLFLTLCLPIIANASSSHVMAVVLADGTIVNIGHCDWSVSLQPGQSQVDMGNIEIPDNVLHGYMVQGTVLVPRPTPLTMEQYQGLVNPASTPQ
jgi:hypothetical protein